ncbi:hypothetical protein Tco_0121220 [Tanacetum coccineum]
MALCTTLQNKVLDLEKTKTTQDNEIASLKREVKKLEKKNSEDASKQERIDAIDADEEITLVSVQNVDEDIIDADEEITLVSVQNVDEEMFDVNVLDGDEVFVAKQNVVEEVVEVINNDKLIVVDAQVSAAGNVVSTAGAATTVSTATTTTDDDELCESTTIISSQQSQDKGKGILIEPVKPMKKKDQIRRDEETALMLQAEFDEEERLAREKVEKEKEVNNALIET